MQDQGLAFILDEALSLLEAGEDPASIVARFPDFSAKLLPLLDLAAKLKDTADDAVEVPLDRLRELGEFLGDQVEDLADHLTPD